MNTKKFTILHSNDMHGDFLQEVQEGTGALVGGLALLSGYINKVRAEEENVLYVISGDMVQGSIIDLDFQGLSTIELMNYLAPDVVTLGNHEFDYGLPHLLFLEKVANFPIVNANLYIKQHHKRLMKPHHIIKMAGFDILFTGIITEKIMDTLKLNELIGSFVTLEDARDEIGNITNIYKNDDIDLTIILTHIGIDSDKELAAMLDPEWGVDMMIGGHSHTVLEKPVEINNILIAQAGTGTSHIGRFDITVDDDTNSIVDYTWQLVPIDNTIAEPDMGMDAFIKTYKEIVDKKYGSVLVKLGRKHTHPCRWEETSLGNLFADALAESASCDVMLLSAGTIRSQELGPVVTLEDYMSCFPYNDTLNRCKISGGDLRKMFTFWMRPENRDGEGECYQVNAAVRATYNDTTRELVDFTIAGKPVLDDEIFTIAIQGYHLKSAELYLAMTTEELTSVELKVISTSVSDNLKEYLAGMHNAVTKVEGRLTYIG